MTKELILNKERAVTLCKLVLNAYKKKEKIFAWPSIEDRMNPEKQLLSVVPRKKQPLWLFFACLGDKMTVSRVFYKEFKRFAQRRPNFFDKKQVKQYLEDGFPELNIRSVYSPGDYQTSVEKDAKKLFEEFNWDPLNMFPNDNFDDCVKALKKFRGYGDGIGSLYLVFLAKYGLKKTKCLVPKIDRHFVRISIGCEVVKIENKTRIGKLTKELFNLYTEICREEKFDSRILDPAVWVIGSELCNTHTLCNKYCPLNNYCVKELPMLDAKATTLSYIDKNPDQLKLVFD